MTHSNSNIPLRNFDTNRRPYPGAQHMPPDEEFPSEITTTWIAQQEFPYNSLVDFIIHLLTDEDYNESELPDGMYRLWLLRRLETDVDNGGFGQFLGNAMDSRDGSDRFLRATLPAVRSFGLTELEPFVAETIRIHDDIVDFERRHRPAEDLNAESTIACGIDPSDPETEAFHESTEARFEVLWDRWTKLDYNAWQLKLEEYIRGHLEEFVFDKRAREE